jgi:hypothetical protein
MSIPYKQSSEQVTMFLAGLATYSCSVRDAEKFGELNLTKAF